MLNISRPSWNLIRSLILIAVASFPVVGLFGQQNRITETVADAQPFKLAGHIHPNATAEYDRGKADASFKLSYVTLALAPSASQQAALDGLLSQQQNLASAQYHKWLTPEEYASRFGASQEDIDKMVGWLESQDLTVLHVARARNAIVFSGTAEQVGNAFHTEIHNYKVNGELHHANATEPSLPVALRGMVLAIRGLHDFRLRPAIRKSNVGPLQVNEARPANTSSTTGKHYLAPDDFATIFDIQPLYGTGMSGAGQTIAIVGQSRIDTSHLNTFRSRFGLPAASLQTILVPGSSDPGVSTRDAQESDLDLEWSSAVARKSDLIFVYASDVMDAVQYTIDENLAPVLSMSYGECEPLTSSSDAATMRSWAQQGSAQGITWVASSGDSGAPACYQSVIGPPLLAGSGTDFTLAVNLPASIPEVTAVGGTEFNEGSGTYWNSTNDATTQASAISYIPETSWNDSTTGSLASSGGGASSFFTKPSWQTGTGVPSDGARDVPDVAFPASADHDGYLVYTTDGGQAGWYSFGGTSAGAPSFAGVLALLNEYLVANAFQSAAGLGNINPHLYPLASSAPAAFHDITSGNNIVSVITCSLSSGCSKTSAGYRATKGYDQVTGLGAIDAYNFLTAWDTGASGSRVTPEMTSTASPSMISTGGSTTLTATVSSSDGNVPTGTVTFFVGDTALGTSELSDSSGSAVATLTIDGSATGLAMGANTVTATYSGTMQYDSATASTTVALVMPSAATPSISAAANAASYQQAYAPGMVMALFGSQLALTTRSADGTELLTTLDNVSVTINGVPAPLYYISPTQLNVQIPYETPTSGTVPVVVSNNEQTSSTNIKMSAAAPGIFTDSSGLLARANTAARGQSITVYFTGAGAVQPAVATGAIPATGETPVPTQTTRVTVGGTEASTSYIGLPSWSVGTVQANFTVPFTASAGVQPVVVYVGGVRSRSATLTITQ